MYLKSSRIPRTMSANFRRNSKVKFPMLTIDIAEPTSLTLLSMMQATRPINRDVALLPVQASGPFHGATTANAAELEESIEDGTIVPYVELRLFLLISFHVVRIDFAQEIDVFIGMELSHLKVRSRFRALSQSVRR